MEINEDKSLTDNINGAELVKSGIDASDNEIDELLSIIDLYFNTAIDMIKALNFYNAYNNFTLAIESINKFDRKLSELLKQSRDINEIDDKTKIAYEDLISIINQNNILRNFFEGYACISLGQHLRVSRNPGDAVQQFKIAQEKFKFFSEKTEDTNSLESIAKYLELVSEAEEQLIRSNYINAKSLYQKAKINIECMLDESIDSSEKNVDKTEEALKPFLISDLKLCEVFYHFCDYKDQTLKGNFKQAAESANKLNEISKQNIQDIPKEIPKPLKYLLLAQNHIYIGHKYMAEAALFREQENWDGALENYKEAKEIWEKGAEYCLKSGLPQAGAIQENLINLASMSNEIASRECKKERVLKETINSLELEIDTVRKSLSEAIKPRDVNINTMSEMITTVEQNTQIVEKIDENIKKVAQEIIEEIKKSHLDENKKQEIESKATDLLSSNEKGPKFLEKAKKFSEDVSEIAKNIEEIAGPIKPLVKVLTLLL